MDNIKKINYKTLSTYNDKVVVKEAYGAFSLSAVIRYPWSPYPNDIRPVIPGVN